jgi:Spy/CpxP family protein refolding chaperone
MVDAYVLASIRESLDLDDQQYARVVPLVDGLLKERRQYYEDRRRALGDLRRLLESGAATSGQIEESLRSVKALETEGPRRIQKRTSELDAALTPIQQAKYRILESEVERRLRELMRRGRHPRSP